MLASLLNPQDFLSKVIAFSHFLFCSLPKQMNNTSWNPIIHLTFKQILFLLHNLQKLKLLICFTLQEILDYIKGLFFVVVNLCITFWLIFILNNYVKILQCYIWWIFVSFPKNHFLAMRKNYQNSKGFFFLFLRLFQLHVQKKFKYLKKT